MLTAILVLALSPVEGLLADVSPPAPGVGPALPVERLGNDYRWLRSEKDRGLDVEVWMNVRLSREERWHRPDGDYYVRVNGDTYVRGCYEDWEWRTDPSDRLVRRGNAWVRRTLAVAR
jgi:hypothetical protein